MKRSMMALFLAAIPLAAQPETPPRQQMVNTQAPPETRFKKLFILKYADPRAVENLLRVFEATLSSNPEMHVLAVTASQQTMTSIEEAIARLDTPVSATKNIEMTVQLVVAGDMENPAGAPLPKD